MIDIVLLVLKIAILVLLYLFIWLVVKTAVGNVRTPAGAALAAPDVALPDGSRQPVVPTPAEREARREERLTERTVAGEALDFSGHIDPRLIVEQSPIVPAGVVFPLSGWVTVGRAAAATSCSTNTSSRAPTRASSRAASSTTSKTWAVRTARS